MTYSVYQHWDPLRVCVVGRSYPPEFYSWIKVPHVRQLFERIAAETEEDFQKIVKKLTEFGVEVVRPDLPHTPFVNGQYLPPPMNPRDTTAMIGEKFYHLSDSTLETFYNSVKDSTWPPTCSTAEEFYCLPASVQQECIELYGFDFDQDGKFNIIKPDCFCQIFEKIKKQGNQIVTTQHSCFSGAMVSRIGKDLYFSTESYNQDQNQLERVINSEFTNTRNHIVNTGGHGDGTYCPVAPGLIISLMDVPTYADTFPGWEVVYLPNQSWARVKPFLDLKRKNLGRWWIPGFEYDNDVVEVVESWLGHWTGYVEETVFDVNMLIVDPKNVIVFNENNRVFSALHRYGITPHVINFRHRYFWDGGIHCVTADLHREGAMQDFFPERG